MKDLAWIGWRGAEGPEWGVAQENAAVPLTSRFPTGFAGFLDHAENVGLAPQEAAADLFRGGAARDLPSPDRLLAPLDVEIWCDSDAPVIKAPLGRAAGPGDELGLRPDATRHLPVPAVAALFGRDGGWIGYTLALAVVAADLADQGRQGPAQIFHHSVALAGRLILGGTETVPDRGVLRVTRHGDPVLRAEVEFGGAPAAAGVLLERVMRAWPLSPVTAMLATVPAECGPYFALESGDRVALETPAGEAIALSARKIRAGAPAARAAARVVRVAPQDNVAVALTDLAPGATVVVDGIMIAVSAPVRFGHKIALRSIGAGEPVIKYGQVIGEATAPIAPGTHVHVHNFDSRRGRGDLAVQAGKERG